jgi:hypothetical protein
MNKPIDARNATHMQIRDWLAISAMMHRIEGELMTLDAMNLAPSYPEIKAALENVLAAARPYSAREDMKANLRPYAMRPRRVRARY